VPRERLFSEKGYKEIERLTAGKTTIYTTMLNINLKDQYRGSLLEKTSNTINNDFGKDTAAEFFSNKTFYCSAVLSVPKIVSVVLLCFSVLLILIVLIVIRHAILSSIEADYVSLGVLKAVGFTGKNIIASILLQYLMISGAGTLIGIILSIFAAPFIGNILLNSTGIFWAGNLSVSITCLAVIAVLAVIFVLSYFTASKAAKISPIRAISFGKSPMHFSSRLNIPLARLHFLPLSVRMALKQMLTKLKQYATLIGITAIFTFMIITITTLIGNFSTTENINKLFGFDNYDIQIYSSNTDDSTSKKLDDIVKSMDETYGVETVSTTAYAQMKIDNMSVAGKIRGDLDLMKDSLIEGKLPQFDNEVAITPLMSETLGKGIGETVEISGKNGTKCSYIITCKIQCVSLMGKVIFLPVSAYKRIVSDFKPTNRAVTLKNSENIATIADKTKELYETSENGIIITNERNSNNKTISTIQSAISLASTVVFSLTFLLIACITILLCSITIYREVIDTGIFKAIGFKAMDLRLQFTLRFILIAILGGIIGTAFGILFDERLIHIMLSSVGIANLKPVWNFSSIGLPILFVVCVTGITAFLCSIKNNRISPSNLIIE
jgi:putative ABC transport system permease protein